MKRAILVHRWDGTPEDVWFPWLKTQLEEKGFEVIIPQLPNPAEPHIETWVPALKAATGIADKDTYFVGHSIGCQTIARYLAELPSGVVVGGVVYVGGYFKRLTLGSIEEEELWATWHDTLLDLAKVKAHAPKSIAIFSDNDPFVPMDNTDDFRDKLGSEVVVESGMGHFDGEDCTELPVVVESVLKLAS